MNRFNALPAARKIPKWAFGLLTLGVVQAQTQAQTLPPPPVSPAPVLRLEYDAQGNPTRRVLAPGVANFSTSTSYDRLGRAVLSTDARGKPTQFFYDGRENLTQVTDPRNLVTQYPRNGLGDGTGLVSPDTGTASQALDAAGNVLSRTDSRGVVATYSYDALNRVTNTVYSQGPQSQVFIWTYDQTGPGFSNGIGRLTSTQYPGGSSTFAYDAQGRLTVTTQTVAAGGTVTLGLGYGYDVAGHITSITYPSGRVLNIPHAGGQPTGLSLAPSPGAAALPLMSALQFEPAPGGVGALRAWNWELDSGPMAHARVFDIYGRMVRHPLGGAVRDISYDALDRIASFTHLDSSSGQATAASQALNQVFGYDELGRLTSVATPSVSWGYAYDDNGNRVLMSLNSANTAVSRLHVVDGASNRLLGMTSPTTTLSHDAAGNITSGQGGGSTWVATVDLSGRVSRTQASTAAGSFDVSYGHNNRGQRVWKRPAAAPSGPGDGDLGPVNSPGQICFTRPGIAGPITVCSMSSHSLPAGGVVFMHDQQGHLLGEYDGTSGATLREYIWLGDLPVAVVDGSASAPQIYYVQTDHLDTPRVLLDRAGRQRWSWVAEPFGNSAPVENPIGVGAVSLNLRMPGQYFDLESGLNYNWHRSYDAGVGRYTQSDPIGLQGGINTYAYVGSNPLSYIDPEGLQSIAQCANPANAAVCAEAGIIARGAGAGAGAILSVPGDTNVQRIDDIINGVPVPRWPGLSSLGECTKGKMIIEPARDKRWRAGGISIEQEYICNCGQITRHTVIFKGAVVHDHFRPGAPKAGGGD